MIETWNNLYISFYAPAPSRGQIYKPGFCWCYNDKYSIVYESRWVPNFVDQIMSIEFALSEIDTTNLKAIYTGPRNFPWTIYNTEFYRKRPKQYVILGECSLRFKKYIESSNIKLIYPARGDIHDNIYRYGMYRVAEKLGKIIIPGHEILKLDCNNRMYSSYNIKTVEKNLTKKGIVSEAIRKI